MKNERSNRVQKTNFLKIFLEERNPGSYYKSLENRLNGETVFSTTKAHEDLNIGSVYEIKDFPGYLSAGAAHDEGWRIKTVNTFDGSYIYLGNYTSAEDYFKKKFSPKRRSRLRTYQRRLDKVFDIQYQHFYGDISKKEYRFVLTELKELIIRRFDQKNTVHDDLHLWQHYYNIAYDLILNKQAVLFVISDGKKPISIALNLINRNLMFPYIRGFDTDYSKFYPGYIDFSEQIKWAFNHNIQVFDLLKGTYPYKDRLKDSTYFFQKQILYNSNNLKCLIRANALFFVNRLFYALYHFSKKVGVYLLYKRLKGNADTRKSTGNSRAKNYTVDKLVTPPPSEELVPVDINSGLFNSLRRPTYDFMYSAEEMLSAIAVFQIRSKPNSFIITGSDQNRLITLTTPTHNP